MYMSGARCGPHMSSIASCSPSSVCALRGEGEGGCVSGRGESGGTMRKTDNEWADRPKGNASGEQSDVWWQVVKWVDG